LCIGYAARRAQATTYLEHVELDIKRHLYGRYYTA
jgi:hypothetical protein